MFPELSAVAGTDPGGIIRQGVDAHADYARTDANDQLRMSDYNLAAGVAGLPGNMEMAPPPPRRSQRRRQELPDDEPGLEDPFVLHASAR
jgi:hypothetical protein